MPKSIRQSVTLPATPARVYSLLMESRRHAAFTGAAARISAKVGGSFSAYDGYITGRNIELVPDKRIVQSWHACDWPDGHMSIAKFSLAKVKAGTRLTFLHSGVPDNQYASIKQGWKDFYWEPMKRALRNSG